MADPGSVGTTALIAVALDAVWAIARSFILKLFGNSDNGGVR